MFLQRYKTFVLLSISNSLEELTTRKEPPKEPTVRSHENFILQVIGPIPPNKEIPLPVHLSEAGQIRWHPVGRTYLWSETHSLSSLLSRESRVGFMKSSVCYPSHPSNDPFRCCVSVEEYNVPSSISTRKGQVCSDRLNARPVPGSSSPHNTKSSLTRTHFIRHVRLNTPLIIKNYLPVCISLTIENCGSARVVSLKEVSSSAMCVSYLSLSGFHFFQICDNRIDR